MTENIAAIPQINKIKPANFSHFYLKIDYQNCCQLIFCQSTNQLIVLAPQICTWVYVLFTTALGKKDKTEISVWIYFSEILNYK